MATRLFQDIETVWHYMQMHQRIKNADCLFCMCSNDERVAEYTASLYLDGIAPKLVFSGAQGRLTEGLFDLSEAEHFAEIAKQMGVPSEHILMETQATNSGENVVFTANLFREINFSPNRILLVQKPYMERRAYATFKQQWSLPYKKVMVTSPGGKFSDYFTDTIPSSLVIETMLGDFERLQTYPEKGFQIEQEIPKEVILAYKNIKSQPSFS
ncbi:YdcF family protein [Vibrio sp. S9_S30]|uniref:YdcF family protein n=1 Tax=Vibrio sp. S9_S30 TaxID=2720226 RepID=UPI0016818AE7|nr:YdcF family protein [Vibrio sp. S9_S30]MBD1556699.1 YdcF family protein [Vibrio sp. S9_S30]